MRPGSPGIFVAGFLTGAAVVAATIMVAAPARADEDARAYAAEYGPAVCQTLDDYGQAIIEQGFTAEQAGEVVALSVIYICPRHTALLKRFGATYGRGQTT